MCLFLFLFIYIGDKVLVYNSDQSKMHFLVPWSGLELRVVPLSLLSALPLLDLKDNFAWFCLFFNFLKFILCI